MSNDAEVPAVLSLLVAHLIISWNSSLLSQKHTSLRRFLSWVLYLELRPSLPPRILRIALDHLSLPSHLLLPVQDPLFTLSTPRPPLAVHTVSCSPDILHLYALQSPYRLRDIPSPDTQHKVRLCILRAPVVLQYARPESRAYRCFGDHILLDLVFGVELTDRFAASLQADIQRVEESAQSQFGTVEIGGGFRVAQPLDGGDTDGGVECAGCEGEALAEIGEEEIPRTVLAGDGEGQHGGGDVEADPEMVLVGEERARETGAAAEVED